MNNDKFTVEVMHADSEEIGLMVWNGSSISTIYIERDPEHGYHVTSHSTWSIELIDKLVEMVEKSR